MNRIVPKLAPALAVVAADQVIKAVVRARLAGAGQVVLIPRILALRYAENRGAAFSFVQERPEIILALTALLLLSVGLWLFRAKDLRPFTSFALSLILGGGVGNLIDRVLSGFVTDYIEVLFVRFAIFNLADCAICLGAFLCALSLLKKEPA